LKVDKKSFDNLTDRLGRLEAEEGITGETIENISSKEDIDKLPEWYPGFRMPRTNRKTLERMSKEEQQELFEYIFNWEVTNILPHYKAKVMSYHNITSEEYDKRTLAGDESIYLPQPNPMFESTSYRDRVAHVLGGLTFQQIQDKFKRGKIKHMIATGGFGWRDEDPNAVF
jgi:hypothetical protein